MATPPLAMRGLRGFLLATCHHESPTVHATPSKMSSPVTLRLFFFSSPIWKVKTLAVTLAKLQFTIFNLVSVSPNSSPITTLKPQSLVLSEPRTVAPSPPPTATNCHLSPSQSFTATALPPTPQSVTVTVIFTVFASSPVVTSSLVVAPLLVVTSLPSGNWVRYRTLLTHALLLLLLFTSHGETISLVSSPLLEHRRPPIADCRVSSPLLSAYWISDLG
ncbi:uncharacterized protein DS421_16g539600 [Arachis hypogaea]|nr:uncharacterized protein DS421_16g539600 [Arachis hypogaea]